MNPNKFCKAGSCECKRISHDLLCLLWLGDNNLHCLDGNMEDDMIIKFGLIALIGILLIVPLYLLSGKYPLTSQIWVMIGWNAGVCFSALAVTILK